MAVDNFARPVSELLKDKRVTAEDLYQGQLDIMQALTDMLLMSSGVIPGLDDMPDLGGIDDIEIPKEGPEEKPEDEDKEIDVEKPEDEFKEDSNDGPKEEVEEKASEKDVDVIDDSQDGEGA